MVNTVDTKRRSEQSELTPLNGESERSELYHEPVFKNEILDYLRIFEGGSYIDCTLGDGGHTVEILRRGGRVLALDIDEKSLERSQERIERLGLSEKFRVIRGNFRDIEELAEQNGFSKVNGILYDLGYSSSQLSDSEKGLSFLENQPLDMRLDKGLGIKAEDLLNMLSERQLTQLFFNYSDERYARRFAKTIVEARKMKKLHSTKDLSELIVSVAPPGYEHGRIHPATRVFQALRIAVNDEISNLEISLPRASCLLLPGGRMLVITFHSLEDKTVKDFGRRAGPKIKVLTKRPLEPSEEEIVRNYRSRSAKLRVFEK